MLQIKKEDFLLFPIVFFWILVFLPKYVQLVFFCLYFTVLASQYGRKKKYDTFFLLQMIYLVIFGISILFNGFIGSHETVRIFAALNTWVINCIAVGSYAIYKSENVISSNKVSKYCFINLVILITLNLIYQLSASAKNVSILGHTLCGADWVEGVYTTRFYGFLADRAEQERILLDLQQNIRKNMQKRFDLCYNGLEQYNFVLEQGLARRNWQKSQGQLQQVQDAIRQQVQKRLHSAELQLGHAAALTGSLDPYKVLARGYTMVTAANGTILNADDLQPEKTIYVRSASRRAKCRVEAVEEINENTQKF